jgi:hypothetical protein
MYCILRTFAHEIDGALPRPRIAEIERAVEGELSGLTPTGIAPEAYAALRVKLLSEAGARLLGRYDIAAAEEMAKVVPVRMGVGSLSSALHEEKEEAPAAPTLAEVLHPLDMTPRVRAAAYLLVAECLCRRLRGDVYDSVGRTVRAELEALGVKTRREAKACFGSGDRCISAVRLEEAYALLVHAKRALEARTIDKREVGWRITEACALISVYRRISMAVVGHDMPARIDACVTAGFMSAGREELDKGRFWLSQVLAAQSAINTVLEKMAALARAPDSSEAATSGSSASTPTPTPTPTPELESA